MKRSLSLICGMLVAASISAQAGIVVIGNLARTTTLKPGESFEGVIFVKNPDAQAADISVFQTDYLSKSDGTSDYGQAGTGPRSNANWITITPNRLKVAPGETQPVRYKGKAPADPTLQGTYWSMIMVEPNSAPAITPDGKTGQVAVGLQTTIRFGIQIVTELGTEVPASLKIMDKRVTVESGTRGLQLDIGNDGERLLIPAVSVELFDAGGASVGRFDAGRARIYPNCSVRAKVDLTGIPIGKYAAMVLLDSGEAEVMGAQYELDLAPPPEPKPLTEAVLAGTTGQ